MVVIWTCSCQGFWIKRYHSCRMARGNKGSQSVVFNSGQKMALKALYVETGQSYYKVKRFQRHLLAANVNNRVVKFLYVSQGCSLEPNLGIYRYHQEKTREKLTEKKWLCFNEHLLISDQDNNEGNRLITDVHNIMDRPHSINMQ